VTQPAQIPNIREEDVVNYFLHTKNPVTGALKNLRRYLDKARKYAKEPKYILTISVCEEGDYVMFESNVRPSMRQGLYWCNITLYKDTGMVARCQCECKVGAVGHCSHAGGMLLKLVGLKSPCTSTLCQWTVPPSRDITPSKLQDINWWPGKANPEKPWSHVYKAGPCNDSHNFCEELLNELQIANPSCTLYVHARQSHADIQPFLDLFECPVEVDFDVDCRSPLMEDLCRDFMEDLMESWSDTDWATKISSEIERATRRQSCNSNRKTLHPHSLKLWPNCKIERDNPSRQPASICLWLQDCSSNLGHFAWHSK
jgi:hypothetical protein